ncbi:hypothetical protein Hanom_Chr03g00203661 [Helianthus anomalus]
MHTRGKVFPHITFCFPAWYSLMNVFDQKVAGGMVVAAFPEGEPGWISRIRDNILHPSNESMSAYNNAILGVVEDESDFDTIPTREELILLSSEESAGSSHGLIHRSSRIVEDPVSAPTRKRFSNVTLFDYVVVSNLLSGLDAGTKRTTLDSNDKKQKKIADKKCELDQQAAAALSEKKLKVMGETVAPSKSEVDLGVFNKKSGNLLEKIYKASSTPRGMIPYYLWLIFVYVFFLFKDNSLSLTAASARSGSKVAISTITPHTSPPSLPFGVSPPCPSPKGKGKDGTTEGDAMKKATPDVALGVVIEEGDPHVEGAETDWESIEATPPGTIYTRRGPSIPGGGGPSRSRKGPEFKKVEGGESWLYHNPSCDNLPHIPHWGLTQGSRMDDLDNCHDFYSLSLLC